MYDAFITSVDIFYIVHLRFIHRDDNYETYSKLKCTAQIVACARCTYRINNTFLKDAPFCPWVGYLQEDRVFRISSSLSRWGSQAHTPSLNSQLPLMPILSWLTVVISLSCDFLHIILNTQLLLKVVHRTPESAHLIFLIIWGNTENHLKNKG